MNAAEIKAIVEAGRRQKTLYHLHSDYAVTMEPYLKETKHYYVLRNLKRLRKRPLRMYTDIRELFGDHPAAKAKMTEELETLKKLIADFPEGEQ